MCEMLVAKVEGWRSRRSLYSVPLPTPEGPEMIIGVVEEGTAGDVN